MIVALNTIFIDFEKKGASVLGYFSSPFFFI